MRRHLELALEITVPIALLVLWGVVSASGDTFYFPPLTDILEKFQELSSAWVHVLPSVKEGWGLSIVEAAQMGVPSVAYAEAGGVRESILDGVTGLLAADQDDLVDKLRLLLVDAELRADLGTKARIRSGQFSWDATADTIAARLGLRVAG